MNTAQVNNQLLSVGEAADLLSVSSKTLRRWDDKGILSSQRSKGDQRRYSKAQIKEFGAKQNLIKAYVRQRPEPSIGQRIGEQKVTKPSWQTSFEAYPRTEDQEKPILKTLGIGLTVLVILASLVMAGKSLLPVISSYLPFSKIAESLPVEPEVLTTELEIEGGRIKADNQVSNKEAVNPESQELRVEKSWDKPPVSINVTPSWSTNVWVEEVSEAGFTVHFTTPAPESKEVYWLALW